MYIDLLKHGENGPGWTLPQIDEMDVHFFFELMDHAEKKKTQPNAFIDQIPGF